VATTLQGSRADEIAGLIQHTDLNERLPLVPPSAKIRGLYARDIERIVAAHGHGERYRRLFPDRPSAVRWVPLGDYLVRQAVGGALLAGPERVYEGMFELGRGNAIAFSESLLGRTLLLVLDRDPKRLLRQAMAGRRLSYTSGHWELAFPGEREAVVTMSEEYAYIEWNLKGAAQGTFEAVGVPVEVQVVMYDRFHGKHILRW
jgi:uncharacterized protein (TIGR02265 family)